MKVIAYRVLPNALVGIHDCGTLDSSNHQVCGKNGGDLFQEWVDFQGQERPGRLVNGEKTCMCTVIYASRPQYPLSSVDMLPAKHAATIWTHIRYVREGKISWERKVSQLFGECEPLRQGHQSSRQVSRSTLGFGPTRSL